LNDPTAVESTPSGALGLPKVSGVFLCFGAVWLNFIHWATARTMSRDTQTGRDATETEIREAERILSLTPIQRRGHPAVVSADHSKLSHINTYGSLPEFYLDQPFTCQRCGKREIWKARDQKWYYEEAKGHIDARAVECHDCCTTKETERG
jgi:hypothetical protein